jgi:cell shape-determining protein MreD
MRNLVAFPILALAVIFQSAIVSRITLLFGYADLVLIIVIAWALQIGVTTAWHWAILGGLMVAIVTGLPWGVPIIGYLGAVSIAKWLQKRIWQAPLISMFTTTFLASIVFYLIPFAYLNLVGGSLPFSDSFSLIILPSTLLNLLYAIPVSWFIRDLARWIHPTEEEE